MPSDDPKTISIRIAIDIPVDIAAETLSKIQPAITQLSNTTIQLPTEELSKQQKTGADQSDEEKERAREFYDENRRNFARKTIQAYRQFRRLEADYDKPQQIYKVLAKQFEWPSSVIASQVGGRKRKVKAYLKARRKKTILRLAYEGHHRGASLCKLAHSS